MKKRIPNYITVLRFIGTAALLFLEPLTVEFNTVFAVCGLFDFADGFLARRLDAKTETGDRLDHIASLVFILISSIRFLSVVPITAWIFFWIAGVTLVKVASLTVGAVKYRKAAFINSRWNKIAKVCFYLFPVWLWLAGIYFAFSVVLAACTVAAAEELAINFTSKEYKEDTLTFFKKKKKRKKK